MVSRLPVVLALLAAQAVAAQRPAHPAGVRERGAALAMRLSEQPVLPAASSDQGPWMQTARELIEGVPLGTLRAAGQTGLLIRVKPEVHGGPAASFSLRF